MPDLLAARQLRQQLSRTARKAGVTALLGPTISTLRTWVENTAPLNKPVMNTHAREMMLIESLYQHSALFGESNPWYLADCLISLFDELTLHGVELPGNLDDFIRNLDKGYGLNSITIPAFTREATLIYTLWRAWHKQQFEEGMIDYHIAYIARLTENLNAPLSSNVFYLLGYHSMLPCEVEWVRHMMSKNQLTMIAQGNYSVSFITEELHQSSVIHKYLAAFDNPPRLISSPHDAYSELLDVVYAPYLLNKQINLAGHLSQRAHNFATAYPISPLTGRLYIFEAYDAEQEANAIDVQIRRWLLEGKDQIGVITENRRLARRLRALLERANIHLQDPAGWALSTTSAASTLERWLETLEEDYDHLPLLDFLKSPYIFPNETLDSRLESVYRLEQDIILHENIARGLDRYRRHIVYRRKRLPWSTTDGDRVNALLDAMEHAAEPLQAFIHARKFTPATILDALSESLRRLGIIEAFANDEAGSRILNELHLMKHALKNRSIKISWNDFRLWLGRILEHSNFSPRQQPGKVVLLNLAQSNLHRFDAVIVASAISEHLPASKKHNPFFNDVVRRDLGLPSSRESTAQQFYHFHRLLECAPVILVSLHRMQNGESVIPSPWIATLQAFHEIAYREKPHDNDLAEFVQHPATRICNTDSRILPDQKRYPAPAVAVKLIPRTFSATMHQQLIDCPYQFYASFCLGLKPPEVIREAMEKSDYGERVHKILQLFHGDSPEAFTQPITGNTREEAIKKLTALSHKEFARDLEDNVIHRGWLKQWLAAIPAYIDWQIKRENEWHIAAVETTLINDTFADNFAIKGRLDRIDKNDHGVAIIDYKTGTPPSKEETESGEAIQLPFYAMLATSPVQRVEYLKIEKDQVKSPTFLEGTSLHELQTQTENRLKTVFNEISHGKPLPAWGDEIVCSRCAMQGVCRKQSWI